MAVGYIIIAQCLNLAFVRLDASGLHYLSTVLQFQVLRETLAIRGCAVLEGKAVVVGVIDQQRMLTIADKTCNIKND